MSQNTIKHTILYVEDDLDDLFIVEQAFEGYSDAISVVHAQNGLMALEYLNNLQEANLLPCLIILDMNMPGMNGRETLTKIKQSEAFKNIPVVMFTTSSTKEDKEFAQNLGADFITKPLVYSELEVLARTFVSKCNVDIAKRA